MIKKLTVIGNSLGIIIEKPILDLLNIVRDTPLEVTTDGKRLIITPLEKTIPTSADETERRPRN